MTPEEIREEVSRSPQQEDVAVVRVPRVHSWSDILAIISLLSIFLGGLVWGMKLENRYDTLDGKIATQRVEFLQAIELLRGDIRPVVSDVAEIKAIVQKGMLPVTEARLNACDERLKELERQHHPQE